MSKKNIINEGGILGFENSLEKISDEQYILIKSEIDKVILSQSPQQNLRIKLLSLKYKMESYLEQNTPEKVIFVGQFIQDLLNMLEIKSKTFAEFIGMSKYDLSKLINGRKKLNYDLALKLGYIFDIRPNLWIDVQNKNEILLLEKEDLSQYKKYKLDDLLSKR